MVAAIRLLVFTGAPLSEVLSLRWTVVDFERSCLRLRDSKIGAKTIHLSAPGLEQDLDRDPIGVQDDPGDQRTRWRGARPGRGRAGAGRDRRL